MDIARTICSQILDDRGAYTVTKKKMTLLLAGRDSEPSATTNLPRKFSTGNVDDTFVVHVGAANTVDCFSVTLAASVAYVV